MTQGDAPTHAVPVPILRGTTGCSVKSKRAWGEIATTPGAVKAKGS